MYIQTSISLLGVDTAGEYWLEIALLPGSAEIDTIDDAHLVKSRRHLALRTMYTILISIRIRAVNKYLLAITELVNARVKQPGPELRT
jgi:hypothetical protein